MDAWLYGSLMKKICLRLFAQSPITYNYHDDIL